jgi:GntR family transcriptional regulator
VIKLVRLRLMDGSPVAVETTYLPSSLFPDFFALYTDQTPLYELLAKSYDQEVVRAEDVVEPVLIRANEARLFEIPVGSLAILIHRLAFNQQNRPIESTKSVFRGDLISFSIESTRERHER